MPGLIEDSDERMMVAKTILHQLGGNRFIRMTGAKNFLAGENALSFQLPKFEREINKVQITLMWDDTYMVEFWKNASFTRAESLVPFKVCEGVYCDQLQGLFTEITGLATRL
jgi:hypothetical protein